MSESDIASATKKPQTLEAQQKDYTTFFYTMQRMQHDTSIIGGGLHRKEVDGRHGMELVVGSVEVEASNNVFFWLLLCSS